MSLSKFTLHKLTVDDLRRKFRFINAEHALLRFIINS